MARSDQQLVQAANRGDAEAFEALYERHRDWVLAMARRLTGDDDLALDVMQETFVYLLRKFPGFELRAAMKTFLYPAVRHLSITAAQRRRRDAPLPMEIVEEAPPAPATDEGLTAAIASLPDAQREVLMLRFVDDLSLQEIAMAMEIPLGTVKSRLHHALKALR